MYGLLESNINVISFQTNSQFALYSGLPTYETATTRQFYNGRTETVRSCTKEAIEFAKALDVGDKNPNEVRALFMTAINKHLHLMEQCKGGQVWFE